MELSVKFSDRGEELTGAMRKSVCMKHPAVYTNTSGNGELVHDITDGALCTDRATSYADAQQMWPQARVLMFEARRK
jgi:hypothetical protein